MRNKLKLQSAVTNARALLALRKEGSLDACGLVDDHARRCFRCQANLWAWGSRRWDGPAT